MVKMEDGDEKCSLGQTSGEIRAGIFMSVICFALLHALLSSLVLNI